MRKLPTVQFDTLRLTATVLADLEGNVRHLPEATAANFDAIYDASLRSFGSGGDLHTLSCRLMTMNIDGMTRERAAEISRQLWFRAREIMDRERRLGLGVTKAKWVYGNAPCMVDPAAPTPADLKRDAAHRAANGRLYVVSEGLKVDDRTTWPGREPGCKCMSKSVFPALSD